MLRHHNDHWMRLVPNWGEPPVRTQNGRVRPTVGWGHPVVPQIMALDLHAHVGGRGRSPIPGVASGGALYYGFTPTRYAAPTAQGNGSGSSEENAQEILAALAAITQDDILGLLPGIYTRAYLGVTPYGALFAPTNSGSNGHPIRICAKYTAIYLDTPGSNANRSEFRQTGYTIGTDAVDPTIGVGTNDYIEWYGIYLDQDHAPSAPSKGTIVVGNQNTHCRLEGIVCRQVHRTHNDNYDTVFAADTNFLTIKYCRFLEGGELLLGAIAGNNVASITFYNAKNYHVSYCDFVNNNTGIFVKGSNLDGGETEYYNDGVTEYCYFEGMKRTCFNMNQSNGNFGRTSIARYNLCVDSLLFAYQDDSGGELVPSRNFEIYHNTIINPADAYGTATTGMYAGGFRGDLQIQDGVWRDNIIAWLIAPSNTTPYFFNLGGVGAPPVETFDTTGFSATDLDRNCYYLVSGTQRWVTNGTTYTSLANWKSAVQAEVANQEANSIESNPSFVDAGNGDYRLSGGSPCEGTGTGGANMGCFQPGMTRADIGCPVAA